MLAKVQTVQFPNFAAPEFKLPKCDLEAAFGSQTANLAAVHEVQSVVFEAVQAIARIQHGWVEETTAGVKALLAGKTPKEPQAMMADVKAVAEKAVAAGKQGVDLGVAAQQRVTELIAQ